MQYTGCVLSADPPDQHGVSSWRRPVAVSFNSHWDVTADLLRGRSLWLHMLVSIWNGAHGADNSRSNINLESRPSPSWNVMQRCYGHCAVNLRSCNDLGLQFLVQTWSKHTLNTNQPSLWINFCDQISTEYVTYINCNGQIKFWR